VAFFKEDFKQFSKKLILGGTYCPQWRITPNENYTIHNQMAACDDNHFAILGGFPSGRLWSLFIKIPSAAETGKESKEKRRRNRLCVKS
jgi:hypothetical protein